MPARPSQFVQSAVDAVIPESVRLASTLVSRAGMRATKVDVHPTVKDAGASQLA